jgi:hypothetical protein
MIRTVAAFLVAAWATCAFAGTAGVVFSITGEPVAGVEVTAFRPEAPDAQRARLMAGKKRAALASATTDDAGAFTIDAKVDGVIELIAVRDGYVPAREVALGADDVMFELRPAKARKGRVSAGGKPVADALVVAFDDTGALWQTHTDAGGAYSIADPKNWLARIAVIHPGFALHISEEEISGVRLDVTLTPGEKVAGTVLTAKGAPASNARLLHDGWLLGTADAGGKFVLPRVAASVAVIDAAAGGATGRALRTAKDLVIQLGEAHSITGSIRDASKRAIAGAIVTAWSRGQEPVRTVTDDKGNYRLDGLRAADFQVGADATERLQFTWSRVNLATAATARADFTATEAKLIRGVVVDERKRPIAGATVQLMSEEMPAMYLFMSPRPMGPVKTARDGRFAVPWNEGQLGHQAALLRLRLQALRRGYAAGTSETLDLSGDLAPLTIVLPDGVELTGLVKDADGKPVAGAGVIALEESAAAAAWPLENLIAGVGGQPFVETDAEGRFRLRVNQKMHDVGVWKESFAPARAGSVSPGGKPLEIVLERGAEIRGRVVRKGTSTLPEGMLVAESDDGAYVVAELAPDGTFTFAGLRPGPYTLTYTTMTAALPVEKRVIAPAENVQFELPSVAEVRGRVLDQTTGEPLMVEYFVTAGDDAVAGGHFGPGEPFMIAVAAGPNTLTVRAAGYGSQSIDVTVEEGKPGEVTFKLARGRKITGHVREEGGAPVGGARIRVEREDNSQWDDAFTTAGETAGDGAFVLDGVPKEALTVVATSDRHMTSRIAVAAGDDDPRLDVTLSLGMKVKGRVVSSEGLPVEKATVTASGFSVDAGYRRVTTDSSGAFTMEGLSAGRYSFHAQRDDLGSGKAADVEIGPAEIVITMPPSTGTGSVHGKVLGFAEKQWQFGMVTAGDGIATATVGRDGSYRLERVPAGEIEIQAQAFNTSRGDAATSGTRKVTVVAGGDVEVDLAFRDDIVIRGTVTENGQPVAGRSVSFALDAGQWSARTSELGTYEVRGLQPGSYHVSVVLGNRRSFSTRHHVTQSGTFDIRADFGRVAGRVVDAEGTPVAGATVTAVSVAGATGGEQDKTDARGGFDFAVPKGSYNVTVSREGFTTAAQTIESDGTPAVITLHRGNALPVRLSDARTGRPLTGYVVAVDEQGVQFRPNKTGDGVHQLPIPAGRYRVAASADGYASQSARITVPADAEVRLALTPGGKLIIRSEQNAAELVKLVHPNGEEYVQCYCNGIAEVRLKGSETVIEHVAPGAYTLRVFDEQGRVKSSYPVTIVEGQTTVADIHVPE